MKKLLILLTIVIVLLLVIWSTRGVEALQSGKRALALAWSPIQAEYQIRFDLLAKALQDKRQMASVDDRSKALLQDALTQWQGAAGKIDRLREAASKLDQVLEIVADAPPNPSTPVQVGTLTELVARAERMRLFVVEAMATFEQVERRISELGTSPAAMFVASLLERFMGTITAPLTSPSPSTL